MLPWTHMEECFSSCIAQPVGICIFSFGRYWWISFRRSRVIFIIIRCICDEISLDSISLYGIQTASHSSLPGILSFQWGPSQAHPGKMLHHDGNRVPCISGWEAWAADSVQGTSDSSLRWSQDVKVGALYSHSEPSIKLQHSGVNHFKYTGCSNSRVSL